MMPKIFRLIVLLITILVFILVGWSGGPQNEVDFALVAEAVKIRSREEWMTEVPMLITHVGGAYVLLPLTGAVVVLLYAIGRRRSALLLFLTVAGERLLLDGFKILIQRPRPELEGHPVLTHSFSFPSGHAANTMTVFVAIALFAAPREHRRWSIPLAITLAALVGATRPWLGVHWPSDVVGGWTLAALSIAAALWAEQAFRLSDPPSRTGA